MSMEDRHAWGIKPTSFSVDGVEYTGTGCFCDYCGVLKPERDLGENPVPCPGSDVLTAKLALETILSLGSIYAWYRAWDFTWQQILTGPIQACYYQDDLSDAMYTPMPIVEGEHFQRFNLPAGHKVFIPEKGNPIIYDEVLITIPYKYYDRVPANCPDGEGALILSNGHEIKGVGIEIPR